MTTNLKDSLEWRSPTNLKPDSGITNGEPARVRWPESADKPLLDREIQWRYGWLVWDYWVTPGTAPELRTGLVRFIWAPEKDMEITNRNQVEVQRSRKGLGR